MKKPIDITLTTIHVGDVRRVVTLALNQRDDAQDFLKELERTDSKKFTEINTRINAVSKYDTYENKLTFRNVGDGIFEFKRPGVRLYAFYDVLEGEEKLILCTNGGKKNKKQSSDISWAKTIKAQYLDAKNQPNTTIQLIE